MWPRTCDVTAKGKFCSLISGLGGQTSLPSKVGYFLHLPFPYLPPELAPLLLLLFFVLSLSFSQWYMYISPPTSNRQATTSYSWKEEVYALYVVSSPYIYYPSGQGRKGRRICKSSF